jgi:hypothetical protein
MTIGIKASWIGVECIQINLYFYLIFLRQPENRLEVSIVSSKIYHIDDSILAFYQAKKNLTLLQNDIILQQRLSFLRTLKTV